MPIRCCLKMRAGKKGIDVCFHSFRTETIYRTFALNAYQAQYLFAKKRGTGKTEFISEP